MSRAHFPRRAESLGFDSHGELPIPGSLREGARAGRHVTPGARLDPVVAALRRLSSTPRLRGELVWVIAHRFVEFGFLFAQLKLLTSLLGKEGYGEYSLAETGIALLGSLLLAPVQEAYLRDYHGAGDRGETRAATRLLLRWYAVATLGAAALLALVSQAFSEWFAVGRWTTLAAGLVFLAERWRTLGQDLLNIERQRRAGALWNLSFLTLQLALVALVLWSGPATATSALLAYAAAAALFGALVTAPLARRLLRRPGSAARSLVPSLVLGFGVPYAALLIFQWVQAFSDRILVKGLLDPASLGLYVAAYQVCGVPFVLLLRVAHELLTPIAYARSRDLGDSSQLWSADRLLLAGLGAQLVLGVGMLGGYALFGSRLLVLLTSEAYALPASTLTLLAAARFAQSFSMGLQPIFAVHQRMGRLLGFRAAGAIVTPAICWLTIPAFGVAGAALGTLLAYLAYLVVLGFGPAGCVWLVLGARRSARRAGSAAA